MMLETFLDQELIAADLLVVILVIIVGATHFRKRGGEGE